MWNIMRGKKAAAADTVISTHEMRFQFSRVLRAVRAGRALTLTYRNKPLARIVPMGTDAVLAADDPVYRLDDFAEPIGPLTNGEIDRAIYGA